MIILAGSKNKNIEGTEINVGYRKFLDLLEKKHTVNGRSIDPNDTVFVLESFDGAEHLKTKKKISSVVFFQHHLPLHHGSTKRESLLVIQDIFQHGNK